MGVFVINANLEKADAIVKLIKREAVTDISGNSANEPNIKLRADLPGKYYIYTQGPLKSTDPAQAKELLAGWYSRCLELAHNNHCKSVQIPLVSDEAYLKDKTMQIVYDACKLFLTQKQADMIVYIVVDTSLVNEKEKDYQDKEAFTRERNKFVLISAYINHLYCYDPDADQEEPPEPIILEEDELTAAPKISEKENRFYTLNQMGPVFPSKEDILIEETFREMLLRLMIEKDMTAPEVYTRACIDRKLFSKIISSDEYQPRKYTVVRLALALGLSESEANEFMNTAGFAFAHGKVKDLIILSCIKYHYRSVSEVNEVLEKWGTTTI